MPDDDFTEWAEQIDQREPTADRGFLWDPPATPEEGRVRANALLGDFLGHLDRTAVKLGYTKGEPAPCIFCGTDTTWRDAYGQIRCFGCPKGVELTPEQEADAAGMGEVLDTPGWRVTQPQQPCSVCRQPTWGIDPSGVVRHPGCPL